MKDAVAIYVRLSDEDRDKLNPKSDSESIQNQKNMLTKYAMEQGWDIYNIYSDDDFSGLDSNRPEYNKLLRDAENNKFNIVLAKTQARFTRDIEHVEKYLHNKFQLWRIRFIGLADHADTFNKGNKKQRQIIGLTNEWYCEDVSENIRSVFDYKRKTGKFIGSFACYGYMKDPNDKNKLIIDEDAANVVRLIFDLYLDGNGTQRIAHILNKKNILNPTKYKQSKGLKYKNSSENNGFGLWNKTTVKRMLKNQMYIGNMVQNIRTKINYKSKKFITNKESDWIIVENTHDPIIDKNKFYEVQRRIKNNQRSCGTGKAHIFATKIKCATCGSTMQKVTTTPKNKAKYSHFRCKLYAIAPSKKLCTNHYIRIEILEEIVKTKLKEYINSTNNENIANKLQSESDNNNRLNLLNKELNNVRKQIKLNLDVLKNLYLDKVKGIITNEEFITLKGDFEKEKNNLQKRKDEIKNLLIETNKRKNNIEDWLETINKHKNFKELNHEIVNDFIDYIEIGEKNKETGEQEVIIHWLF